MTRTQTIIHLKDIFITNIQDESFKSSLYHLSWNLKRLRISNNLAFAVTSQCHFLCNPSIIKVDRDESWKSETPLPYRHWINRITVDSVLSKNLRNVVLLSRVLLIRTFHKSLANLGWKNLSQRTKIKFSKLERNTPFLVDSLRVRSLL